MAAIATNATALVFAAAAKTSTTSRRAGARLLSARARAPIVRARKKRRPGEGRKRRAIAVRPRVVPSSLAVSSSTRATTTTDARHAPSTPRDGRTALFVSPQRASPRPPRSRTRASSPPRLARRSRNRRFAFP